MPHRTNILALGAGLAMVILAGSAPAGTLLRRNEGTPFDALAAVRQVEAVTPKAAAAWAGYVDAVAKVREEVPRKAFLDPKTGEGRSNADLGDGFLEGFARMRGLRQKLEIMARYRVELFAAGRWLEAQDPSTRRAIEPAMLVLAREAEGLQRVLVGQIGGDLARGGRALEVTAEHFKHAGYYGETAYAAFAGLTKGLKQRLVSLANDGAIDDQRRTAQAESIQVLEALLQG